MKKYRNNEGRTHLQLTQELSIRNELSLSIKYENLYMHNLEWASNGTYMTRAKTNTQGQPYDLQPISKSFSKPEIIFRHCLALHTRQPHNTGSWEATTPHLPAGKTPNITPFSTKSPQLATYPDGGWWPFSAGLPPWRRRQCPSAAAPSVARTDGPCPAGSSL